MAPLSTYGAWPEKEPRGSFLDRGQLLGDELMLPHQAERRRVLCGGGFVLLQPQEPRALRCQSRDQINTRHALGAEREHQLHDCLERLAGAGAVVGDGFQLRGLAMTSLSLLISRQSG